MISLIITSIFMVYFQYFFAVSLGLGGTIPNLYLPLIIYYSITRENLSGLILAFLLGIIIDLNQPSSFGVSPILFLIIAFVITKLKKLLGRQVVGIGIVLVFISNIFYFFLSAAIFLIFKSGEVLPFGKLTLLSLYNSLYSFIIILILYLIDHLKLSFTQQ
ncbi:MAG: rod shape-determining protein MreD [Candidatus Cloacimonetes bacterium]|nr:rod shape-determining protein MreD [Candidatus Cloacimonadota bacterium]